MIKGFRYKIIGRIVNIIENIFFREEQMQEGGRGGVEVGKEMIKGFLNIFEIERYGNERELFCKGL